MLGVPLSVTPHDDRIAARRLCGREPGNKSPVHADGPRGNGNLVEAISQGVEVGVGGGRRGGDGATLDDRLLRVRGRMGRPVGLVVVMATVVGVGERTVGRDHDHLRTARPLVPGRRPGEDARIPGRSTCPRQSPHKAVGERLPGQVRIGGQDGEGQRGPSSTAFAGMVARTGLVFTSLTVTWIVAVPDRLGEPLSVAGTAIESVPGPWSSVGVHEKASVWALVVSRRRELPGSRL